MVENQLYRKDHYSAVGTAFSEILSLFKNQQLKYPGKISIITLNKYSFVTYGDLFNGLVSQKRHPYGVPSSVSHNLLPKPRP
jgi:hypothetical protein